MIELIRYNDVDDDGNRIPAEGKCYCGNVITLWGDEECEKCGREYNSSGQELRKGWSWDDDGRDDDTP